MVLLGLFGFFVVYPYINKLPTCTDGKQNGDEAGIDCGGSCPTACSFSVDQISILWTRAFEVVPGRYNAVAYLENHNKNAAIDKIKYKFRFSDKDNIYIGKREGETFIPPSGKFAIFEPGIDVGNAVPVYTNFEFTETPKWQNVSEDKLNQLKVSVSDIKLEGENTAPHLSATVVNNSIFDIPEIKVISVLYNRNGDAVSASSTYIDKLKGGESKGIDFTWPEPIKDTIVSKEIIPMFNFFLVNLK